MLLPGVTEWLQRIYIANLSEVDRAPYPQPTINAVNKEVAAIASTQNASQKNYSPKTWGEYIKVTARDQATIGEYAAKNGIAVAFCHFKRNGKFPTLKEATVRG